VKREKQCKATNHACVDSLQPQAAWKCALQSQTSLISAKPLITVKEARKLLGASAKNLTNEEIKVMIRDYTSLARYAVRDYLVRK
jgi:hypothetical protein